MEGFAGEALHAGDVGVGGAVQLADARDQEVGLEHFTVAELDPPQAALRVRASTNVDTPIPPDEPLAQNPPAGAILDYFLGPARASTIFLDISDTQGRLVRRFCTTCKPDVTMDELEKQHIPLYWIRLPRILSTEPGMHRWVWDLHYPAPVSVRHEFPISAVPGDTPRVPQGPRALPGKYTIRLIVDSDKPSQPVRAENPNIFTHDLTITMDPRVKASPAELEAMFKLQTRLARMMTASSEAILQARSIREQLEKLTAQATGAASDAIKALDKKIAAILDGSGEPGAAKPAEKNLKAVNDDIYTLYTAVDRADAAPTPAQEKAASAIEADLRPVMKRWEELKTTDLAALNRQLKSASLPEIRNEIDTHLEEEPAEDLE